ncbi:MAG: class F sortase [Propionibacterium sp.]|nr:class F sortase [Propionibacterium sp.]
MSKRNRLLIILASVVAVVLVVAGGLYFAQPDELPEAASTPTSPAVSAPTTTSAAPSPAEAECTTAEEGFIPVRYTFEGAMTVDEPVLALGEDANGNIAAPPPAEKRTAAWWENGPLPATAGKTILSIHTYRNGGALGNEMYEGGESQMQPGDIIKLYSADGEIACYEFTEAKRIMVEDYDPDSDVMIDYDGESEVAIIICWDFNGDANEAAGEDPWESRVFFYGTLV